MFATFNLLNHTSVETLRSAAMVWMNLKLAAAMQQKDFTHSELLNDMFKKLYMCDLISALTI